MLGRATRRHLLTCLLLVSAGAVVPSASAYTLTDWMRSWPSRTRFPGPLTLPATPAPAITLPPSVSPVPDSAPPPAPAPATSAPATSAPATSAPAPACGPSVPQATAATTAPPISPEAAAANACVNCCAAWLAPLCRLFHGQPLQTRYRTTWVPVPTTDYRQVVSYHPTTGAAVTSLQPCTTYTWQMRRVPVSAWSAPLQAAGPPRGVSSPSYGIPATPGMAPSAPPGTFVPPATPGPTVPGDAAEPPQLSPDDAQRLQQLQRVPSVETRPAVPRYDPPNHREPASQDTPPRPRVTPVPDPERSPSSSTRATRPPAESVEPTPSSRWDPRDRTALRPFRQTAVVVPIVWPNSKQASAAELPTAASASHAPLPNENYPATSTTDNQGWRAVWP